MSLEAEDAAAAAVAVAPRVTLQEMQHAVSQKHVVNLGHLLELEHGEKVHPSYYLMTIAAVAYHNGFVVLGTAACASPENYNRELGEKIAADDAIRQSWPLFGFALRDRLAAGNDGTQMPGDPNTYA